MKLSSRKKKLLASLITLSIVLGITFDGWAGTKSISHINNSASYIKTLISSYYPFAVSMLLAQYDDLDLRAKNLFNTDTSRSEKLRFLKAPKIFRDDKSHFEKYTTIESDDNLDSTGKEIRSYRYFDSLGLNDPYPIGLDNYLARRKQELQGRMWDSLTSDYDLKRALSGGDLAKMLSQATGMTIPIPPNPLSNLFGKPEISINVSGEVNLRVGWRWDTQNLGTVSAFGQSQSSPIFNQDIRVAVNGQIGDKFKIGTDWNTRQTFDYNNKFKVGYDGYDDDIIKKIEFGNVDFQIPSTLIGSGSSLFGVRADFQFGPLFLKTVFSQRRGQRRFIDVKGGAGKQYFSIRAYDYAKNHFFLDTVYKGIYDEYFKYSTPVIPQSSKYYRIKDIEVWEAITEVTDPHVANAIAIADLPGKQRLKPGGDEWTAAEINRTIQSGVVEKGRFALLDSSKYYVDRNLGTLTIFNLRQDRYYGVAYKIEGATDAKEDDIHFGKLSTFRGEKDTLVLRLVYRPNLLPGYKLLWDRQMKNVYSINASNVNTTDTKIGLWYTRQTNDSTDLIEGAPDKLVTIFGVDQVNNSTGAAPADGNFDLKPPFFDPIRGEITFPSTEPFADGLRRYFTRIGSPDIAEQYAFDQVYDTTYDVAKKNTARDRFVISGEVTGRQSNRISLGAYNLAPNSVKVTLDGVTLREYEDYTVDYYQGTVTLKNPRATLPNANLKIEYEQQDVFSISTKTLAGIRGDLQLMKRRFVNWNIGFTGMYYDQSATVDRVRLGDEPVSNVMLGFDSKFTWNAQWLTRALDMLPFYDTKAPSNIGLRGEWAVILPEPNKRKSDISTDNNLPVVYIDDFEGAQRSIPLGLVATQWSQSSPPEEASIDSNAVNRALWRGKMFWYQYFIPKVPITDPYPDNTSYQSGKMNINPLMLKFDPYKRGIYNKNPEYLDASNPNYDPANDFASNPDNRKRIWGGMMRLFSSFNTNFDNENIEFLEIMLKIDQWDPDKTKMFIDIGQISEDIIPDGVGNSEDGITKDNPLPNGIIDNGEDVGIDGLNDEAEKGVYPAPLNLEKDPAKDNYSFNFNKADDDRKEEDFEYYNNYEGNAKVSELGQFPDKEMLNPNNGQSIAMDNSYFTYEVNLYPDPNNNSQIVGGNPDKAWFLYRIPIRKPSSFVGSPSFANIQYIRVRFQGGVFKGEIADWELIGSQWQRISNFQSNVNPNDSVLQIAFVNLWENSDSPTYYSMPPGVSAPKQMNSNDANDDIRLNEQSLSVTARNLRWGEERMAVRVYYPSDIYKYKKLKFFVHGDGSMPSNIVPGARAKAYAYLRFGTDSSNYYEYRRPLIRGWQDLEINLEELSSIKQIRDAAFVTDRFTMPVQDDEFAIYAIKGNPILTRVQFFGLGIANPSESFQELSTTMWVDELRLLDPEASADWAGVANFDMALADLGTVNMSFSNYQPNFHKIEERFGNRITSTNWSFNTTGNLEKFAPKSFSAMKVPITFTHTEYMETPEFMANSDISLSAAATAAYNKVIAEGGSAEAAKQASNEVTKTSQTMKVQDGWALTGVKLGIPVKHWLMDKTFNALTMGYSYSQEYERSSLYKQKFNWMWRLNLQYSIPIPEIASVKPVTWLENVPVLDIYKNMKMNFLPSTFSSNLDMQRRRITEQSRYLDYASPVLRDFTATRNAQFNWKLVDGGFINPVWDYNFTTTSTLVPFELDETGRQRTGGEIADQMFFKNKLVDLGRDNIHTQTFSINIRPKYPNIIGLTNYMENTGTFSTSYQWQDLMQSDPSIADQARRASWNNTIKYTSSIRLKSYADKIFGIPQKKPTLGKKSTDKDTTSLGDGLSVVGSIMKTIFLDWEKLDIGFNQQNTSNNPGVYGSTGLSNFWAQGMTGRSDIQSFGPSFAYQLGLVTNPHGGFKMVSSDAFPFFGFKTFPGKRPANAILQDNYNQNTTLDAKTSRPLWEGATLELTWKTTMGYNKNQTVETDAYGNPKFTNVVAIQTFNRTFLTCPDIFGYNPFNNTIENVVSLYKQKKTTILASGQDTLTKNQMLKQALSDAFYNGLEAFSMSSGSIGKFLPSLNWGIRWEGLEKMAIWKTLIKKMSVEHLYTSTYQENVKISSDGRSVQNQIVQYGFNPLIGVTASFDEKKLDGMLTTSLKWSTTTAYQMNTASGATVSKQATNEITAQASYTMRGWEFPLFGINLKNDLEYSFLFTFKDNNQATYDLLDADSYSGTNKDGRTLTGNKQIIIEPRARYSLSNRVTASFFVRYEGTFNEGAAQPGFHTTQVGLDLRISISGGR